MKKGLIHLYHGDGKGKTTAALGLMLRALGRDYRVLFVQFLKNQPTGELKSLAQFSHVKILRGKESDVFSFHMSEEDKIKAKAIHNEHLQQAIALVNEGLFDLLVLDEVVGAYDKRLLDGELLLDFLRHKPNDLEVVMTGRNPDEQLVLLADYVSEIKKIKHPYDQGVTARVGIEL